MLTNYKVSAQGQDYSYQVKIKKKGQLTQEWKHMTLFWTHQESVVKKKKQPKTNTNENVGIQITTLLHDLDYV